MLTTSARMNIQTCDVIDDDQEFIGASRVAVLVPCYNEGLSIRRVVKAFRGVLPSATIYVYDNKSSDNTANEALEAGALVRSEPWPGKGNVVRRMFSDIDADIYVMVDGDGTYDPGVAPRMIRQ